MRAAFISGVAVLAAAATVAQPIAQVGATNKLGASSVVAEATNDLRQTIVPEAGQKFLWIKATLAGAAQTIDLTKVTVQSGGDMAALIGVDAMFDGDPKQFSMIAPVRVKGGAAKTPPLEETKSAGPITFAFTPGKVASLKLMTPPQSVCLLFAVPATFQAGGVKVKGLGTTDLSLPAAK